MRRATALAGAILGMTVSGAALAGTVVVVDAHGLALKPGQALDDSKALNLAVGQSMTVITARGDTLKLRGPYHQRPVAGAGGGGSLTIALASLIVRRDVRASDVGAVRGGGAVKLPEPWVIDVSHPGTRCVREATPTVFWRATADKPTELSIAPLNRAWRLSAPWARGADRVLAPRELPMPGRATYVIDIGDGPVAITLLVIPAAVANDRMRAAWMFEQSCNLQAETLAQSLTETPDQPLAGGP